MHIKYFSNCDPGVAQYVSETFVSDQALFQKLVQLTRDAGMPIIQIADMDARHLQVLVRMCQARKIVEIGTLGGFSGSIMLRAAGPLAKLWTFEKEEAHANIAKKAFELSGVQEQVQIITGLALEELPAIEKHAPFDLVFIDADKANHANYLEWAYKNLKTGGVVIGDNTFAFNEIYLPHRQENPGVKAIRQFNHEIANSQRWLGTILPTGEGMTIGIKI